MTTGMDGAEPTLGRTTGSQLPGGGHCPQGKGGTLLPLGSATAGWHRSPAVFPVAWLDSVSAVQRHDAQNTGPPPCAPAMTCGHAPVAPPQAAPEEMGREKLHLD